MLQDKDVKAILKDLIPLADKVIATRPDNPRAIKAVDLAEELKIFGKETYFYEDIKDAVKMAAEITGRDEAIIFAGSLYMIGEVRKILKIKYYHRNIGLRFNKKIHLQTIHTSIQQS